MRDIPEDAPAWLAHWIGQREEWRAQTDIRLINLEQGQKEIRQRVDDLGRVIPDAVAKRVESIINGAVKRRQANPDSSGDKESTGVMTWRDFSGKILIPLLLSVIAILLGLMLTSLTGG